MRTNVLLDWQNDFDSIYGVGNLAGSNFQRDIWTSFKNKWEKIKFSEMEMRGKNEHFNYTRKI